MIHKSYPPYINPVKGKRAELIEPTRALADAFKKRLRNCHSETATCLGEVLCIRGQIDDGNDHFTDVTCVWNV